MRDGSADLSLLQLERRRALHGTDIRDLIIRADKFTGLQRRVHLLGDLCQIMLGARLVRQFTAAVDDELPRALGLEVTFDTIAQLREVGLGRRLHFIEDEQHYRLTSRYC